MVDPVCALQCVVLHIKSSKDDVEGEAKEQQKINGMGPLIMY
jgi:hypothetical protein